jgi:VWFA-related protein
MRTRLCIALFVCVVAATLAAQRPESEPNPQQPTSHGGANYVRVDMYAYQDGEAIGDLKADEIEIREDGALQKIEKSEHVVQAHLDDAARATPANGDSGQMAVERRPAVFVVFVDTLHTQIEGSEKTRLPIVRFIDQAVGKDDMVAIMTPEMSARDLTFGHKTTVLSNIMQSQWDWGRRGRVESQDAREQQYDECYPEKSASKTSVSPASEMKARRREKFTFDALDDLVTVLAGPEERKAVLVISDGWVQYKDDQNLASALHGGQSSTPPDIFGRAPRARTNTTGGREVDAAQYAQCEADRTLLAKMDNRNRLRDMSEQANRANVSFYTVYARGVAPADTGIVPDRPSRESFDDKVSPATRQDSLRFLADNTDGISIVSGSQVEKAIARIVSDASSYYLLSYASTNTKLDGRFRAITVKVLRPDAVVRARRGYRGATAEQVTSTRSSSTTPVTSNAASGTNAAVVNSGASFRIRASGWMAPTSGKGANAKLWIVGEVDYHALRDLAWSSGAQAEVTMVSGDGATVLSKTVDMPATSGTFALQVPGDSGNAVAPGEYAVRVRVKPQGDPTLRVSDVARVLVTDKASTVGEAMLWRRGPSTGPKYVMTADPRFTRTERIRLELPTRTTMPATAKLLDRSGKAMIIPVQVSERDETGGDFRWIVVEAALAALAPGDYAIDVTADDAHQVTAFKVVP